MKPKFYFDEMLKQNYWFFIDWKESDVLRYLEGYFSLTGVCLKNKAGMALDFVTTKVIYIEKSQKGVSLYALLAHECIHAANMTFASRGIVPSNDELLAYYVELLIRKALEK